MTAQIAQTARTAGPWISDLVAALQNERKFLAVAIELSKDFDGMTKADLAHLAADIRTLALEHKRNIDAALAKAGAL